MLPLYNKLFQFEFFFFFFLFLREIKKKLWLDSNRWDHDRFDLSKQGPKSREELVDSYGYDIRAHSKPPDSVPFLNNRGRLVDLITYVLV